MKKKTFAMFVFILALSQIVVGQWTSVDGNQKGMCDQDSWSMSGGASIDLYTQKGGKGPSMPSDSFAPLENVTLFSNVTHNMSPVQNVTVQFEIYGPPNPYDNITMNQIATTDANGIATTSFIIPWVEPHALEKIFGIWNINATSEVYDLQVSDTLTFECGWIIELLSVETGVLTCISWLQKTVFSKQDRIDVKIDLKNIAFTPKNVCIGVRAFDTLLDPILEICQYHLIPGKTTTNISIVLGTIPIWAHVGPAEVCVNAFTDNPMEGGQPYCPEMRAWFDIKVRGTIRVPEDYPTIQEAIIASSYGDIVLVSSGTYYEHIVVNKTVWLVGEQGSRTIIDGKGTGVGLYVATYLVKVKQLTIKNFSIGISISYPCSNTFFHNNFIGNEKQIHLQNSCNTWDNGCEGNYWSNYNGSDLDGDGIGDEYLPWEGVDYYPLMSPYIEGDVNHDAIVDVVDLSIVSIAFWSTPIDPKWNPHADLNGDNLIDIVDLTIVAIHLWETW